MKLYTGAAVEAAMKETIATAVTTNKQAVVRSFFISVSSILINFHFAVLSAGRKSLSTQTSVRRSVPAVNAMRVPSG